MEGLGNSVKALKKDRDWIDEKLLSPLEDEEKDVLNQNKVLPLCAQSRIFRLKKLLEILNQTIMAIENFENEDDVIEKIPQNMLKDISRQIQQKCLELHNYCQSNIINGTSQILGNTGSETEKHTAAIHTYIEHVLHVLQKTGKDLTNAGIVTNNNKISHNDENQEDPSFNTLPGFHTDHKRHSLVLPEAHHGRKLSFVGQNVVLMAGTQGQVDMANAMLVDSLLMQMPHKYRSIEEDE